MSIPQCYNLPHKVSSILFTDTKIRHLNLFQIPDMTPFPSPGNTVNSLDISGGSGSEFIGFGLACRPWFRVRVHRVLKLDQVSGLSGFRV